MPTNHSHVGVEFNADSQETLPIPFVDTRKHVGALSADLVATLRTAAASLAEAGSRSDSSDIDSDDELLMDVEVRTSGPDSALISNKTEIKDDDEDIRDSQTDDSSSTVSVKAVNKDTPNENVRGFSSQQFSGKDVANYSGVKDLSFDVRNDCKECPDNEISQAVVDLGMPTNSYDKTTITETDTKTSTISGKTSSDIGEKSTASWKNAFYNIGNHEIIQCESPPPPARNRLDNSSLTKLLEAALLERENKEIITESVDHKSIPLGNKCNGFNTGEFPKLKQMLTKGFVSDATMQFTDAMFMGGYQPQGINSADRFFLHGNNSETVINGYDEDVRQNNSAVEIMRNACRKRCQANETDSIICVPPKKSKCFKQSDSMALEEDRRYRDQQEARLDLIHSFSIERCRNSAATDHSSPTNRQCSARVPPPVPLLPPCRVCGEKASGFHYGVNTCEACKGFYRRSLCRKEPYVCVNSGNCEVQAGRRTVCSYCRLQRCLDVGMSKNAIKTGRYTHELRSKNIMEVKQLQQQKNRGTTPIVSEQSLPQIIVPSPTANTAAYHCDLADNEKLQETLDKLMMAQTYLFEFLDDYYDADLILKRQMEVYNQYKKEKFDRVRERTNNLTLHKESDTDSLIAIPPRFRFKRNHITNVDNSVTDGPSEHIKEQVMKSIIEDMERGIQGLVMFAKSIPGFVDLDVNDQSAILKCSRFDIWFIGHIRCLNSSLRVGACEWYFHAEELEQVWGSKLVDMCFRLTDYGQKLNLTREETAALRAVSLTFPDRCILKDRKAVEDIHAHMFDVFQYVASKRHKCFYKWLPDVINFLVYLRDFAIEFDKKACQMNIEWPVIQKNPLLLEVFFS